jgi:hypothetical protein
MLACFFSAEKSTEITAESAEVREALTLPKKIIEEINKRIIGAAIEVHKF